MVTPRRSARVAASDSSPVYTDPPESGRAPKRKSEPGTSPSAKRGKKSSAKSQEKQQTIEDAMDIDKKDDEQPAPAENGAPDATDKNESKDEPEKPQESAPQEPTRDDTSTATAKPADAQPQSEPPAEEPKASGALIPESTESEKREDAPAASEGDKSTESKPTEDKPAEASQAEEKPAEPSHTQEQPAEPKPSQHEAEQPQGDAQPATNGDAVEPKARDDDVPSSILEKGIVYFFFRARVNISDPQDVNDIARSYMILRPIPKGAKLGDGPIGDEGNCRLIAIPKKVLPLSGKDRFMSFVEGAKKSFKDLKTDFLSSSDYATKTVGTSHSPPATPIAEGVYAITTTGRESHLAYMTTIPSQLGEVQKDIGLKDQGSFVVSAKNPKAPGPANASLAADPGYPSEILDEFRGRRWMPLQPNLLDFVNTQFLLIGESFETAVEGLPRDEKKGIDPPQAEMEKLEGEDEIRVKHLAGDDAVFADLGVSKKDFPSVPTTWE